jgi:hypothetical protein
VSCNDLDGGLVERGFHITVTDPGDHEELDDDDRDGYGHGKTAEEFRRGLCVLMIYFNFPFGVGVFFHR